jgi:hypothetical protein
MTDRQTKTDRRDVLVGAAIRRFDPPEHAADFWTAAEMRLAEEAFGASGDAGLSRARPRRLRARVLHLGAAAAAIAVAAAIAYVLLAGVPGTRPGAPSVATAADLLARMDAAWTNARTIQGRLVEHHIIVDKHGRRSTVLWTKVFAATAEGDFRFEQTAGRDGDAVGTSPSPSTRPRIGWITVYDSTTNTMLSGQAGGGGGPATWVRIEDYWPGTGPSPLLEFFNMLSTYSMSARAALGDSDGSGLDLTETTYDGRPAWRAVIYDVHREDRTHKYEILVDAASGFPMSWSHTTGDGNQTVTQTCDVTEFEVDRPVAAGTFSTTAPRGWGKPRSFQTSPSSGAMPPGYVGFCSLDQVEERVGYAPPVPGTVPDGYRLSVVATAPLASLRLAQDANYFHGGEFRWWFDSSTYRPLASWHEPDSEVGLTYRRGFDSFWIQAAPAGERGLPTDALVRQLRHAAFSRETRRSKRINSGQFAGWRAISWYDARGVGVLVWDDELAVYIGGSLTRAEALAVAGSLQPYVD